MPPAPADLLPHRPPMVLLDEVLGSERGVTRCRRTVRAGDAFVGDGGMRAIVALELLAQAAAVHRALQGGGRAAKGLLAGAPQVELLVDAFALGDVLDVEVEAVDAVEALHTFRGTVRRGGDVVARARLQVVEVG